MTVDYPFEPTAISPMTKLVELGEAQGTALASLGRAIQAFGAALVPPPSRDGCPGSTPPTAPNPATPSAP